MRGVLDDLTAIEHHDLGRVADGGQAVGDREAGLAFHQLTQTFLDQFLGAGVDVAGGLVQDHDLGLRHHGAGDGDHLALALAQVGAALGQHGVVTLGQVHDELVGVGLFGRLDAFLVCGALPGIFQVVHDRIGEQEGFLQHDTDLLTQAFLGQFRQVLTIDQDGAAVDIVVTGQDIDQRALACSRWTADADRLTWLAH